MALSRFFQNGELDSNELLMNTNMPKVTPETILQEAYTISARATMEAIGQGDFDLAISRAESTDYFAGEALKLGVSEEQLLG